jgi:hypothetical protein
VHVIACKYWMMGRILSRSILYTREVSPLWKQYLAVAMHLLQMQPAHKSDRYNATTRSFRFRQQ